MKALKALKQGTIFRYGGREFVVLEPAQEAYNLLFSGLFGAPAAATDGVLVMDTKSVTRMAFRKEWEDCNEEQPNNYAKSDPRAYLEKKYLPSLLAHGAKKEHFIDMRLDLTATDGTTDYGRLRAKVGLLTLPQFAKYFKCIPKDEETDWTWLLTPWATPSSPEPFGSTYAWVVYTDGTSNGSGYCASTYGIRPVLSLDHSIFVSVIGDTSDLDSYTNDQLVDEIIRRREAEKGGKK